MRIQRWAVATSCVLLALGCSGSDDGDGSEGLPTTAPETTSTSVATSTTPTNGVSVTWSGRGFDGLEWGADRATTIAALSDVLGPPSRDEPGECGQYAEWRDPNVSMAFAEDGRFGTLHFSLADFPHASGVRAGDPIDLLQSAETDGTWQIFGRDGQVTSTGPQQWSLRVGDVLTQGLATGPAPDGRLEGPVSQYSTLHEAPPCGD